MISIGKRWSLRRLTDNNGFFKMASLDQRPPIEDPIAQRLGSQENLPEEIVKFKRLLIKTFQDKSTAMLLDPSFAVAGCLDDLDARKGLFVSLEDPYSRKNPHGGSLTTPIPNWSVSKIKRLGADAVKLLIWYRPDADDITNNHQKNLVEHVGQACMRYDIPFVLELLAYAPHSYEETLETKATCVLQSLKEFSQLKYHVDVFMVESPVEASQVPGVGNRGWEIVQSHFDQMAQIARRPWVMLSMGADMAQFHQIMTHAYKAGCSGYLAGRAYWLNTLSYYPDWKRIRIDLQGEAQDYIMALNILTDETATAWHSHFGYEAAQTGMTHLDKTFCLSYLDM
jgi:tagatose 1,6-diphosphate aldolase